MDFYTEILYILKKRYKAKAFIKRRFKVEFQICKFRKFWI